MVNNRPRGILTESDRELLRMGGERREKYSRANLSQRWSKIQERTRNGIEDFNILYHDLPDKRRHEAFEPLIDVFLPWSWVNLLSDSFGFQLLGIIEQLDRRLDDEKVYEKVFEESVKRALSKHSGGTGIGRAQVEVDVRIDNWAPYDAIHEHEELSDLRPDMLRSLLNAREISDEEFAEAILEQSSDEE